MKKEMLTETELELMSILWRLKEGSVADVIAELPKHRDLAYTSVSTILRILEQKKVLKTRKEGRGHVYIPALQKAAYEAKAVQHVVKSVFAGKPLALVRQLLQVEKLSSQELDEMRALIEEAGKKK